MRLPAKVRVSIRPTAILPALPTLEKAVDGARASLTKLLETTVKNCILEVRKGFDDLASLKIEVHNLKNVQHRQITLLTGRLDYVFSELSQTHNEAAESTNQVQQELTDLRSQVSDLQKQINISTPKANNSVSVTDYANEIATLRTDTADLRQLLDNTRSYNTEWSFPSRELDILTSSIAKIGNHASHVETLQMEFEILKGRMERVETDQQTAERQKASQASEAGDTLQCISRSPASQKRTSSEAGLSEADIVAKLPVASARFSRSTHKRSSLIDSLLGSAKYDGPGSTLAERRQNPRLSLVKASSKNGEPSYGRSN